MLATPCASRWVKGDSQHSKSVCVVGQPGIRLVDSRKALKASCSSTLFHEVPGAFAVWHISKSLLRISRERHLRIAAAQCCLSGQSCHVNLTWRCWRIVASRSRITKHEMLPAFKIITRGVDMLSDIVLCCCRSPHFGIAHALCLGLAPWLAAEIPYMIGELDEQHVDRHLRNECAMLVTCYSFEWQAGSNAIRACCDRHCYNSRHSYLAVQRCWQRCCLNFF